jgi:hypothetical protein
VSASRPAACTKASIVPSGQIRPARRPVYRSAILGVRSREEASRRAGPPPATAFPFPVRENIAPASASGRSLCRATHPVPGGGSECWVTQSPAKRHSQRQRCRVVRDTRHGVRPPEPPPPARAHQLLCSPPPLEPHGKLVTHRRDGTEKRQAWRGSQATRNSSPVPYPSSLLTFFENTTERAANPEGPARHRSARCARSHSQAHGAQPIPRAVNRPINDDPLPPPLWMCTTPS